MRIIFVFNFSGTVATQIKFAMKINRDTYLKRLIDRKGNSMVKVVTGIRRCGKSYLLFNLFVDWLVENGVANDHIIRINLEDIESRELRDPMALYNHVLSLVTDDNTHYVLLDEVQLVEDFEDVLNGFLNKGNMDVYVTGSNAKYLSSDVITEFRGRGDEVRIHPLCFSEFMSVYTGDKYEALDEYMLYGGLPQVVNMRTEEQKVTFLTQLFAQTYLKDIKERHSIRNDMELDDLINIIASSIGSLTNPGTIHNTFKTHYNTSLTANSIKTYLDYLTDTFIVERAKRFDVKGRQYIGTPYKYYMADTGLRNARLGFSQYDTRHLMENIIYNELRKRGYNVDVGMVPVRHRDKNGIQKRSQLEVDFICHLGNKRYYVQSAYKMDDDEKIKQETASLNVIEDSYKKIILTGSRMPIIRDMNGIVIMNIYDFLLNENSLDL